ncbi:hypothetical protein EPO14_01090 [Patescibacteria group bacterium]|nr:MAG: hypothetical protein EPO14_01090 [Patescibacteria group bacterium]
MCVCTSTQDRTNEFVLDFFQT